MDGRQKYLLNLHSYIEGIDKEVTMILQSLQWDRKHLLEGNTKVTCKYDQNHRVPPDKREGHEKDCLLKSQGYSKSEKLLPEPLDTNASTLVKLSKSDIEQIINNAANGDPTFRKGPGGQGPEPQTLGRLQTTYSADERRALHDAVVSAVPSCHDLADLALHCSNDEEEKATTRKSRLEILAELRDMKRRRAKYRGSTKSRNYSDVLRDVITTQMELYTGTTVNEDQISTSEKVTNNYNAINIKQEDDRFNQTTEDPDKFSNGRRKEIPSREYSERENYSRDRKRFNDNRNNRKEEEREKYARADRSNSKYNNEYKNYSTNRPSHSGSRDEYNKRIKQERDTSKSKDRHERCERDRHSRASDKHESRSDRYHRSEKYAVSSRSGKIRHDNDKYSDKEYPKRKEEENNRRYYESSFENVKHSYDDGRKRKRHS